MRFFASILILAVSLSIPVAKAEVDMLAVFTATNICPANKKKKEDNPGDIQTVAGHHYKLLAKNSDNETHYWIVVPDAPVTENRWVHKSCGIVSVQPENLLVEADTVENTLAVSWEPGFCVTRGGSGKPECEDLKKEGAADLFGSRHLTIHGLWPDDLDSSSDYFPCFCSTGAPTSCRIRKSDRRPVTISPSILAELEDKMPGVKSDLQYHEWSKHGTCYEAHLSGEDQGSDPDEYYRETILLLDQLNKSAVGDLFTRSRGEILTKKQIETAFQEAFGPNADKRVLVRCGDVEGEEGTKVITGLHINLGKGINDQSDLGELILSAPDISKSTRSKSCAKGLVVMVEAKED